MEGTLEIFPEYTKGLKDIRPGDEIVVLFHFHKSAVFTDDLLIQTPKHKKKALGVFSICTPRRPNPIGLSVLEVIDVDGSKIHVRRVDMFDGTPHYRYQTAHRRQTYLSQL